MRKFHSKILTTFFLIAIGVTTSHAGIMVHDKETEFSTLIYDQGDTFDLSVFKSDRTQISNLFDNNVSTMLSLGDGGSLTAIIDPSINTISSGTIIELTQGNDHKESATIELGINGMDWLLIGEVFGDANVSMPNRAIQNLLQTAATLSFATGDASVFTITVSDGFAFNSIRITDTTQQFVSGQGKESVDGFDIASFSVTSVSSPATLGLLGLSIAALGFAGRRRKSA